MSSHSPIYIKKMLTLQSFSAGDEGGVRRHWPNFYCDSWLPIIKGKRQTERSWEEKKEAMRAKRQGEWK